MSFGARLAVLVSALLVIGTSYLVYRTRRARTPKERFRAAYDQVVVHGMHAEAVPAEHASYADTGGCLRSVDPQLHRLFRKHTEVPALRVALFRVRPSLKHARTLHWPHLVRTDGTLRDSCGEIARAMRHYRQWRDLIGSTTQTGRRLFRTLRQLMHTMPIISGSDKHGTRRRTRRQTRSTRSARSIHPTRSTHPTRSVNRTTRTRASRTASKTRRVYKER